MSRSPRAELYIDPRRADAFEAKAQELRIVRTDLIHAWIVGAARAVLAGNGHRLPRAPAKAPRGTREEQLKAARYTPGLEEQDESWALLESVGSSARAVVEEGIDEWLAVDGSWLRMRLPGEPRRTRRVSSLAS